MGMSNAANTKTIAQVTCANAPNLDLISLSSSVISFGPLTGIGYFRVQRSLHFERVILLGLTNAMTWIRYLQTNQAWECRILCQQSPDVKLFFFTNFQIRLL
jgi:hypothetical protein